MDEKQLNEVLLEKEDDGYRCKHCMVCVKTHVNGIIHIIEVIIIFSALIYMSEKTKDLSSEISEIKGANEILKDQILTYQTILPNLLMNTTTITNYYNLLNNLITNTQLIKVNQLLNQTDKLLNITDELQTLENKVDDLAENQKIYNERPYIPDVDYIILSTSIQGNTDSIIWSINTTSSRLMINIYLNFRSNIGPFNVKCILHRCDAMATFESFLKSQDGSYYYSDMTIPFLQDVFDCTISLTCKTSVNSDINGLGYLIYFNEHVGAVT